MAEQVGKFLTELPELTSPSDSNLMYVVDGDTSKKATLGNLKKIVGGDVTGAGSGAVVSFSDGADDAPLESLSVAINPAQDLHGYDKPWAEGAGKNKVKVTAISTTVNDVVFTVYSDGTIKAQGTANANTNFNIHPTGDLYFTNANYTLSGCPTGGSATTYCIKEIYSTEEIDIGNGVTRAYTSSEIHRYAIYISSGTSVDLIFKPMICLSTASNPTTFEPYSNICPITPRTAVNITVSATQGGSGEDTQISLGQNVYGGTLNVKTGELTVTKRIITENEFSMMGGGTSGGGLHYFQIPSTEPQATSGEAISNMLVQNQNGWGASTPCFSTNTGAAPNIYPVRVYASSADLATFKTDYAGLQIVYTLATPQSIQLTPQEVRSILGQNYIKADSGDVDLVYVRDLNIVINDLINRVTALENE